MMIWKLNHPSCPEYFDIITMPNLPYDQFYPGQTLKLKAKAWEKPKRSEWNGAGPIIFVRTETG